MAHSRFIRDTGLTVRMTTVMFLLGAAFVALVVVLMYAFPQWALIIGLAGIGVVVLPVVVLRHVGHEGACALAR